MTQEKLVNLSTMSIERTMVEELDCKSLIDTFAKFKARRVDFTFRHYFFVYCLVLIFSIPLFNNNSMYI